MSEEPINNDDDLNKPGDERTLSEKRADAGRKGGSQSKEMTVAAVQQRRDASEKAQGKQTGPVTEEGKEASSRNAWKTGIYSQKTRASMWQGLGLGVFGKPCKSTCHKYPCDAVNEGETKPGGDCKDMRVYVEAFDAIISGLSTNDPEYTHGLLAAQVAGAVDLLSQMRETIRDTGPMVLVPFVTSKGDLIKHNDELVGEYKLNPLIPHYTKLLGELGLNLPELMATPRAVAKDATEKENGDKLVDLFSGLGEKFGMRKRRTFNSDGEEVA